MVAQQRRLFQNAVRGCRLIVQVKLPDAELRLFQSQHYGQCRFALGHRSLAFQLFREQTQAQGFQPSHLHQRYRLRVAAVGVEDALHALEFAPYQCRPALHRPQLAQLPFHLHREAESRPVVVGLRGP